ncbi:MAG TPA: glycine zipper 2TM domain-containing protein [Patescibacteria group bacterium]|nr:glycine zipper 2TM domain-containing protein [Patescibacteria group bacterium]
MKKCFWLVVLAASVFVVSGCQTNKTKVAEGAGIGGLVGGVVGGIIGHQSGHDVEGVLIGGAVGATGGAIAGSQIDKPAQGAPAVQSATQLSMQQVVDLTKQGVSGDDIIAKIKATHSTYALTADDIAYLRKQGVSQRVIEAMQGL